MGWDCMTTTFASCGAPQSVLTSEDKDIWKLCFYYEMR